MSKSKNEVTSTEVAVPSTVVKTKSTPVHERKYILKSRTPQSFKGKQRQIVYSILLDQDEPITVEELAPLAELKGLTAVGGVLPSVRYHLHHLVLLELVEVINPTIEYEVEVKTAA